MAGAAPDYETFQQLADEYDRVPIVVTLMADTLTPVNAFARLERSASRAFLLESVVGGEKVARYSFLGANPSRTVSATRDRATVFDHAGRASQEMAAPDPLKLVASAVEGVRVAPLPGLPQFLGGAVGYAGYDTIRYYEQLPNAPADDRDLPDLLFDIYETIVIFDHVFKLVHVVSLADPEPFRHAGALFGAYEQALGRIEALVTQLQSPLALPSPRVRLPASAVEQTSSNVTRSEFEAAVERCREYIRAGDIFQVVLSQRLMIETSAHPFDIYRASRVINPSPFMFYLKSPEVTLVGASPEIMCRVEEGVVTNRPLAGTRKRGRDESEDQALRAELLADPKERAEHVMLVDLGRNDVGRVCRTGSVQIRDLMTVENYSHVMHISSCVTGELADGLSALDALRATLPVGTVSGAPKVRAMEIIDELEPTRRGPYAGAVGYIDFAGNMDTCIALRTLVIQSAAVGRWRAYGQVGAGIVADSIPENEYDETMNKARSMLSAIRLAEDSFEGATGDPAS